MIEKCCAFTGHRPKKFPWGYNETDARCVASKKALTEQIAKLVDGRIHWLLLRYGRGADIWAALTVLDLKKENPALKLHCILPCEGQSDWWSDSARELYYSILGQAALIMSLPGITIVTTVEKR